METLKGKLITLETINQSHYARLKKNGCDPQIWTYRHEYIGLDDPFEPWFQDALSMHDGKKSFVYIVIDNQTNEAVGTTSFYEINHKYKTIDIGYTWYTPRVWGSYINPECKLLLLTHVFEVLQFKRAEFRADSRNERSIRAMQYLGAKVEAYLRKAMYITESYTRDTVILSIIDEEWQGVKEKLLLRLKAFI